MFCVNVCLCLSACLSIIPDIQTITNLSLVLSQLLYNPFSDARLKQLGTPRIVQDCLTLENHKQKIFILLSKCFSGQEHDTLQTYLIDLNDNVKAVDHQMCVVWKTWVHIKHSD